MLVTRFIPAKRLRERVSRPRVHARGLPAVRGFTGGHLGSILYTLRTDRPRSSEPQRGRAGGSSQRAALVPRWLPGHGRKGALGPRVSHHPRRPRRKEGMSDLLRVLLRFTVHCATAWASARGIRSSMSPAVRGIFSQLR